MAESRDSTSNHCDACDMYKSRIRELERITESHRKLNGELRILLAEWTSTNTQKDTENK